VPNAHADRCLRSRATLPTGHSGRVDDPAGWLLELGYSVETNADDLGVVWADLRSLRNPDFVVSQYGSGPTADDAIASAADRWRVEQIGTDNLRRPGDPLP
jgi:hypothetical protein